MRILRITFIAAAVVLAVYAAGCGGNDKNPVKPGGGGADVTITILGNNGTSSYSPSPDTVIVGQTVAWHNNDSMTHTATGTSFNTDNVSAGATSAPIAMNTIGTFTYHCTIHPTMTGTLVVKPIPIATADVTIDIVGIAGASSYSPSPDTVLVGQTVAWHNSDSMTHTATADNASFNTTNVLSGATSAPISMLTTGTFPYHCSIHPTMTGILVVK